MPIHFEIQSILNLKDRDYIIFARSLNTGTDFHITDKSFLGGVELKKSLEIPRALNDQGEQRNDIFVFHPKNEADISNLKEKQIVELIPGDKLHCLKPWHFADDGLTKQLHREINKNHVLYGKGVKSIARRQDNDDVLFEVENADFKYAMVHLTWSQKILKDSYYPRTITYADWLDVYEKRMIIDNVDWVD